MNLEELQGELDALPDQRDIPNTIRAQEELWQTKQTLMARLSQARHATYVLAEVEPQFAELTRWHDLLVGWRQTLCDRLLTLSPRDPALQSVTWSIQRIDRNLDLLGEMLPAHLPLDDMMAAAGYVPADAVSRAHGAAWLGCLPQVERQLRELQQRRDHARAELAAALRSDGVATSIDEGFLDAG